jgi:hypothetical protein
MKCMTKYSLRQILDGTYVRNSTENEPLTPQILILNVIDYTTLSPILSTGWLDILYAAIKL